MRNLTNISEINNLDAIKGGCGGGRRSGGRGRSYGGNCGNWAPPSGCGVTVTPEPIPAPTPLPAPERNPSEMGGGKPE